MMQEERGSCGGRRPFGLYWLHTRQPRGAAVELHDEPSWLTKFTQVNRFRRWFSTWELPRAWAGDARSKLRAQAHGNSHIDIGFEPEARAPGLCGALPRGDCEESSWDYNPINIYFLDLVSAALIYVQLLTYFRFTDKISTLIINFSIFPYFRYRYVWFI